MEDNIENIINQNRDLLDISEPTEGHFERFKQKLDKQHRKTKFKFYKLYSIAASVIICIVGTFFFITNNNDQPKTMNLSSVSEEYKEIELYYNHIIDKKMQELKQNSPDIYTSFKEDQEAMERTYEALQKELYRNPDNQLVIESMMANYKTRVDILDRMNQKLEITNIAQK